MATLSLCMIVKNEERTLGRVLEAARQFCDEMIVVDTGSTDRTVEIALNAGAKVHHFAWVDDFAAARNYSFEQANGDWIIWLDADDLLPDETIEIGKKIKAEVLPVTPLNVIRCAYEYAYDDKNVPTVIQARERWIRQGAGLKWKGRIHEVIDGIGDSWINCPEFKVEHRTAEENAPRKLGRNLAIYEKGIDIETADTHDLYLYAGELRGAGREKEAIPVLVKHLKRWPPESRDLFEEEYMVRIDLIECMRRTGDFHGALMMAGNAIAYNGARAEGYALAGMVHYETGNFAAAFPAFLAAAACKPPIHGGVVYLVFYGKAIHDVIKECKERLGHPPMQEKLDKPAE